MCILYSLNQQWVMQWNRSTLATKRKKLVRGKRVKERPKSKFRSNNSRLVNSCQFGCERSESEERTLHSLPYPSLFLKWSLCLCDFSPPFVRCEAQRLQSNGQSWHSYSQLVRPYYNWRLNLPWFTFKGEKSTSTIDENKFSKILALFLLWQTKGNIISEPNTECPGTCILKVIISNLLVVEIVIFFKVLIIASFCSNWSVNTCLSVVVMLPTGQFTFF